MAETAAPPSTSRPGITVRDLLGDRSLGLEVRLVAGGRDLDRRIAHPRIQKSGLVLVGHTHGLVPERVQILGETELSYVEALSVEAQRRAANFLFSLAPCLVLVPRGAPVPEPLAEAAEQTGTPLAVCRERSSVAITRLHALLDERLAPRTGIHGVLVDVFEIGVLLLGKSGIGKSECALELVMRGHRLVADDAVECDYRPPGMVFGAPADLLRHHLEVRGLGILNVKDLFGVSAIRERKRIDGVVKLGEWSRGTESDRRGLDDRFHTILGDNIRELVIPVRPGRDMASILEVAARNELLKNAGHHAAREFFGNLESSLMGGGNERAQDESAVLPPVRMSTPLPPRNVT